MRHAKFFVAVLIGVAISLGSIYLYINVNDLKIVKSDEILLNSIDNNIATELELNNANDELSSYVLDNGLTVYDVLGIPGDRILPDEFFYGRKEIENNRIDIREIYTPLIYPSTKLEIEFTNLKKLELKAGDKVFFPYLVYNEYVFAENFSIFPNCPIDRECIEGIVTSIAQPGDGLALSSWSELIIELKKSSFDFNSLSNSSVKPVLDSEPNFDGFPVKVENENFVVQTNQGGYYFDTYLKLDSF